MNARTMAAPSPVSQGSSLGQLVRLESRRYLRHPLYLVGSAFLLLSIIPMAGQTSSDQSPLAAPIAPAFLMGVFGLVTAAQLTRSAHRVGQAAGAAPVPERTRTLAIALSFVVPVATAAVWLGAFLAIYGSKPGSGVWWFGKLPTMHVVSMLVATTVVAAFGGPALGLLLSRWSRWRAAPLLGALLLVVLEMISQGGSGFPGLLRLVFPWTAWSAGVSDHKAVYLPGAPGWWLVYAMALCALAVLAAVRHDPDADTRLCRRIAGALVAVAVVALTLSMTTGAQHTRYSPVPVVSSSS
jgi:hypothetical protein